MQVPAEPNRIKLLETFARTEKLVLVLEAARTQIRIVNAGEDLAPLFCSDLVGSLIQEVTPPDVSAVILKTVCRVLSEGREAHVNYLLSVGGIKLDFVAKIIPISADSVLWLTRNAAAMRLAELPVHHQLELSKAIIGSLGEGVCAVDVHGRLLLLNPSAQSLLGWTESQLADRDLHDLLHGPSPSGARYSRAECPICDAIRRQCALRLHEAHFYHKDGSTIPVSVGVSPIVHSGRCEGGVITFRDDRGRIALEERLSHAHKMEAVGQLAGGVAHDFNNLLTVINGYAALLLNREDCQGSLRGSLNEIAHAGQRAAVLTQHLLAFSRRQVLKPQVVALNAIITGLQPLLRRLICEDIDLQICLCDENTQVMADPDQLEQVIVNLALNARDAMPSGGRISFETSIEEVAGNHVHGQPDWVAGTHVRLTVKDSGVGMAPDVQVRIFEPFFTTKEPGKGTGLGLSMAYGVILQSGGHIIVDSAPGAGTSMAVLLPQATVTLPPEPRRKAFAAPERGNESILLVEDDESVREFAREVLLRAGYRVSTAGNGSEAMHIASNHSGKIDLLLSDVVMPGASGPEVAKQFLSVRKNSAVLFMSGYMEDSTFREHGLAPGAVLLHKPFSAGELLLHVRRQLDRSAATILVADDQPAIRTLLRNVLIPFGYSILEAENGRQVLSICRGTQVDLVITDLAMPEADGLEAIPELRKEFPAIHIVAMCGIFHSSDLLQMAQFLGAEAAFSKPLDLAALTDLVHSILQKGPRQDAKFEREYAHV